MTLLTHSSRAVCTGWCSSAAAAELQYLSIATSAAGSDGCPGYWAIPAPDRAAGVCRCWSHRQRYNLHRSATCGQRADQTWKASRCGSCQLPSHRTKPRTAGPVVAGWLRAHQCLASHLRRGCFTWARLIRPQARSRYSLPARPLRRPSAEGPLGGGGSYGNSPPTNSCRASSGQLAVACALTCVGISLHL